MLIPYSTDAPLYHWPIATVALIVVNVLVFLPQMNMNSTDYAECVGPWMLSYGEGLHPLQWVTSNFLHSGLMHLLGNMFVLWGFGLVVEGKVGWWRFLLIYLGLGVVECAIEQTCTLGTPGGGSLGASSIIYGLMAISLVWAPQNEMSCLFIWRRVADFDIAISTLAAACLALQILTGLLGGLYATSQFLHLLGVVLGFGWGVLMLKCGWVDCEGWDLFSVWAGKNTQTISEQAADTRREIERLIARERSANPASNPLPDEPFPLRPDEDLIRTITTLQQQGKWSESIPPMVEYLRQRGSLERQVRLKLAHVLLESEHRPAQALLVLSKLESAELDPAQRALAEELRRRAAALRAAGLQEAAIRDW